MESPTRLDNAHALQCLRRQWRLTAVLYALAALAAWPALNGLGLPAPMGRWALPVALAMAAGLALLRTNLPHNHRRGEADLFPTLGPATAVTLARGCLLGLLAGFLFLPRPAGGLAWLPVLVYTAAALTDFVDGYVARRTNRATVLGERLDMELDSLGALIAVSLAIAYGQLPLWALLMGLARYLFVAGILWRRRRGLPIYDLPPSVHRRAVAALFMSFVAVILWPVLYPPVTHFVALWFALPLAASFGRDWLVVSGRADPASPAYQAALGRLHRLAFRRLPLALRPMALVAVAWLAFAAVRGGDWTAAFAWPGVGAPRLSAALVTALGAVGCVSVVFGLEARLGALLLLIPAGVNAFNVGLTPANATAIASTIVLLHTGPGAWALWRASDRLFLERLGRPRR
ncbi:MAG: CDP-alcohol phosphatidyltransferase family protein [Caldilineales bacterium]|nr:CDP-alcohol phosphatidyltransferase family protein [Caldilineales bacterium]